MLQLALFAHEPGRRACCEHTGACAHASSTGKRKYTPRRTRSIRCHHLSRAEKEQAALLDWEALVDPLPPRPRTRGECANVPRPCPYVSCRHHMFLAVDEDHGAIRLSFPDREPGDMPADKSCALDIAEQGEQKVDDIAAAMNVTRQRAEQMLTEALRCCRAFNRRLLKEMAN